MSVIFADLAGFTAFSDERDPRAVSEMLNAYFQAAIPAVVGHHGGEIDQLIGDAMMATFNTRGDQPDHAQRAARPRSTSSARPPRSPPLTPTGRAFASASTPARRSWGSSARAKAAATR